MFEQASLDSQGAVKNPWAFTVSVAGQTVIITAAVLLSLIHTDALPRSGLFTTLVAPGVPKAPPPRNDIPPARRAGSATRVLTYPSTIPTGVAREAPGAPTLLPAGDVGDDLPIIGASGTDSGLGHTLSEMVRRVTPPHQPPTPAVTKPAVTTPPAPISVSKGVQSAKIVRQVNPVYPPLARQARISGTVRLVAIIGRDGAIQNLQVTSGHPLLTPAAVEAVRQWLYRPTLLSGEPVEVITQIDVNFTLLQ